MFHVDQWTSLLRQDRPIHLWTLHDSTGGEQQIAELRPRRLHPRPRRPATAPPHEWSAEPPDLQEEHPAPCSLYLASAYYVQTGEGRRY